MIKFHAADKLERTEEMWKISWWKCQAIIGNDDHYFDITIQFMHFSNAGKSPTFF